MQQDRRDVLEFLNSYLNQLHEARLLTEQLRELEEVIVRITPYLGQSAQVMQGPNLHKLEQSVERLEALRGRLAQKLDETSRARAQVVVAIELLEDERIRQMMRARYLLGRTWVEIARMLDADERWLRRQHAKVLEGIRLDDPDAGNAA